MEELDELSLSKMQLKNLVILIKGIFDNGVEGKHGGRAPRFKLLCTFLDIQTPNRSGSPRHRLPGQGVNENPKNLHFLCALGGDGGQGDIPIIRGGGGGGGGGGDLCYNLCI